jgi:hypothetical protein
MRLTRCGAGAAAATTAAATDDWSDFDFDATQDAGTTTVDESEYSTADAGTRGYGAGRIFHGRPVRPRFLQSGTGQERARRAAPAKGSSGEGKEATRSISPASPSTMISPAAPLAAAKAMPSQSADRRDRCRRYRVLVQCFATMEMPAVTTSEPASFDFSLHGDDDVSTPSAAPSGQMFQFDAQDDPLCRHFPLCRRCGG